MSLVTRRVRRLARTRSPRLAAASLRREASVRRAEAALAIAARRGEPILAGPFLGEVGYELLYWIPFLRRVLREHRIPRGRVTVLTRGGAGAWYSDFAASEVDALDLVSPDVFRRRLLERRGRAGDAKQLGLDPFDLELAAAAEERLGPAHLLHPRLMYARLRFLWERLLPIEQALRLGDYALLSAGAMERGDHVAVKLYSNEAFPDTQVTRAFITALVKRIAVDADVVVLAMETPLDEHDEWAAIGARAPRLDPRRNLAEQTRIVAGAQALISTYGGFSYLGPLLGTPTLALAAREPDNLFHLELLRAVRPAADYTVVGVGDEASLETFLARALVGARS